MTVTAPLVWALLAIQATGAPPATSVPSPATAPAPTPAPATPAASVAPGPSAGETDAPSAAGLDELRRAYHDSCEVRLYGEYDDICSALSDQIRRYRSALARETRRRAHP